MTIVLIIFTPHYGTILPSLGCILSINFGFFGFLYYLAIDLDPISLTTTVKLIEIIYFFILNIFF